ncbi:hypothetical protein, partial [Halomonas campaniensis]
MASVTFPEELGGNGQTYTDDADPDTGLDGLGYTTRFIPCLQQAVAMGLSAQSNAAAAASYVAQCQTLRNQAAGSASAAAGSASTASTAANTATTKAGEASDSADAAASSASTASTAAGTATTKAGEASDSADAAA